MTWYTLKHNKSAALASQETKKSAACAALASLIETNQIKGDEDETNDQTNEEKHYLTASNHHFRLSDITRGVSVK